MMITLPPAPMVFLDFDGTVSRCDAIDLILEHYADKHWLNIEESGAAARLDRANVSNVRWV
jgi:2-hydroxy-3-keto-5-methylthiopentenyl-1-phosphate phosphatase